MNSKQTFSATLIAIFFTAGLTPNAFSGDSTAAPLQQEVSAQIPVKSVPAQEPAQIFELTNSNIESFKNNGGEYVLPDNTVITLAEGENLHRDGDLTIIVPSSSRLDIKGSINVSGNGNLSIITSFDKPALDSVSAVSKVSGSTSIASFFSDSPLSKAESAGSISLDSAIQPKVTMERIVTNELIAKENAVKTVKEVLNEKLLTNSESEKLAVVTPTALKKLLLNQNNLETLRNDKGQYIVPANTEVTVQGGVLDIPNGEFIMPDSSTIKSDTDSLNINVGTFQIFNGETTSPVNVASGSTISATYTYEVTSVDPDVVNNPLRPAGIGIIEDQETGVQDVPRVAEKREIKFRGNAVFGKINRGATKSKLHNSRPQAKKKKV